MPAQDERKDPLDEEGVSSCLDVILFLLCVIGIIFFPPMWFAIWRIVSHYERAVIMRLGKMKSRKPSGPGLFVIIPCIDEFQIVDLRTLTFDVPKQELLTKDSVSIQVDAVVYYKIFDAVASVARVQDVHHSTRLLSQTCLRDTLSSRTLSEILADSDNIAEELSLTLDKKTDDWGVKVCQVNIKDVKIPPNMQRSMAAEAEAQREAKAKEIAARGERDAAMALREAADMIKSSDGALQLRYLQALNSIAAEKNSTIVFPLPINLVTAKK